MISTQVTVLLGAHSVVGVRVSARVMQCTTPCCRAYLDRDLTNPDPNTAGILYLTPERCP